MRRLPRLIVLGSVIAAIVSACGAPSTPPPKPTASPAVQAKPTAATGKPAAEPAAKSPTAPNIQRVVISTNPPGVESNDVRNVGQLDTWHLKPMYEYLVGLDHQADKLIPQLATEWQLESPGPAVRFKLRRGVQFHKGHGEFTAKDVVFSWQDVAKEDSQHGESRYWRTLVKDIEVVNDYEVVFHLNRPDANFLHGISEAESGMEMRSKAHADTMGEPSMEKEPYAGTGPYQYKERAQAAYIRYERVPQQHWRATPDFPELELRFQREPSTRLASLIANEVHLTLLPTDLQADAERRGMKILRGAVRGPRVFFQMNCCFIKDPADLNSGFMYPESPLMDIRVRQALNKAINRDEINTAFFAGKAELMVLNHFHPQRAGWNPEWEVKFADAFGYDPARARALLAEAGYGPGRPLTTSIFVNTIPQIAGADDIAETLAGYWEAVGVQVERVQMDPAQITAGARQFRWSNHIRVGAPSGALYIGVIAWNTSRGPRGGGVEDPVVDALVDKVRNTLDEAAQDPLWRDVGNAMFERQMSIPLFWLPSEVTINPNVVEDYQYPGAVTGTFSHVQNIRAR